MTISSRTPEGVPNRCPVCDHDFRIEPSLPSGDAPCPACGSLVWFGVPQPESTDAPTPDENVLIPLRDFVALHATQLAARFETSRETLLQIRQLAQEGDYKGSVALLRSSQQTDPANAATEEVEPLDLKSLRLLIDFVAMPEPR